MNHHHQDQLEAPGVACWQNADVEQLALLRELFGMSGCSRKKWTAVEMLEVSRSLFQPVCRVETNTASVEELEPSLVLIGVVVSCQAQGRPAVELLEFSQVLPGMAFYLRQL